MKKELLIIGLLLLVGCNQVVSKNYDVHKEVFESYNCENIRDACIIGFPLTTTATYYIWYNNGTQLDYDAKFEYNMYNVCHYYYPEKCLNKSV